MIKQFSVSNNDLKFLINDLTLLFENLLASATLIQHSLLFSETINSFKILNISIELRIALSNS